MTELVVMVTASNIYNLHTVYFVTTKGKQIVFACRSCVTKYESRVYPDIWSYSLGKRRDQGKSAFLKAK